MNDNTTQNHPSEPPSEPPSYGQKFKDQIPSIILTAALVIGAGAFMYKQAVNRQESALAPLREQNDLLRSQADENRRQIEAATQLIRDAVSKQGGELFKSDEEIQKLNGDRINALAEAIAQKVEPALPSPKTPEELAAMENEQVDKISTRIAEKMQPALADLSQKQQGLTNLTSGTLAHDNQQIQSLNTNLQETQAAAQDALKLSQEVSTLYLDSFQNHGVLARVLNLPADVIRDAAGGNFISGRDRKKAQAEIDQKMQEIENRLGQIQGTVPLAVN